MRPIRAVVLCFLICAACPSQILAMPPQRDCLSYGPAVVRLKGAIISRTYPGPPEYESIWKGDEPETYWLLVLPSPACVDANTKDFEPAQRTVSRIQLVFRGEKWYRIYRSLLGKRVIATGTLFAGFNIHHKTPVLLTVQRLARGK